MDNLLPCHLCDKIPEWIKEGNNIRVLTVDTKQHEEERHLIITTTEINKAEAEKLWNEQITELNKK
jgi:hypothetical protein